MSQLSPKQQEIRLREQRILDIARPIVVQHGYHGLSMDRIAAEGEYSKGTVYNHFSCKEEVIVALAIQTVARRVEMFKQAAQFKGCSRYRMMAIGQAAEKFVRDFPDFFMLEQIIQLPSVRAKISEKRQNAIDNCEVQCMTIVTGVVRDAIAAEDLVLPDGFTPEKLVFGLWALTSGGFAIALATNSTPGALEHLGLDDPFQLVYDHTSALLDGYQWQPAAATYDHAAVIKTIHQQVFGDE